MKLINWSFDKKIIYILIIFVTIVSGIIIVLNLQEKYPEKKIETEQSFVQCV